MANAMIGFVVPKINQSITRYYHRNDKKPQEPQNTSLYNPKISQFMSQFESILKKMMN